MLAREFGQALALADVVAVLDVYPARERAEDFPGVSGLTDGAGRGGRGRRAAGALDARDRGRGGAARRRRRGRATWC